MFMPLIYTNIPQILKSNTYLATIVKGYYRCNQDPKLYKVLVASHEPITSKTFSLALHKPEIKCTRKAPGITGGLKMGSHVARNAQLLSSR